MANISDLPIEILGFVFLHLDQKAFLALVKVSRTFKSIAEDRLYQEIIYEGPEEKRNTPEQPRRDNISLFLRSIIARPELCQSLVKIRSTGEDEHASRKVRYKKQARDGIKQLLNSANIPLHPGERLDFQLQRYWAKAIEEGSAVAALALVLSQSINIQSLVLELDTPRSALPGNEPKFLLIGTIFHNGAAAFRRLKSVSLSLKYSDDLSALSSTLDQAEYQSLFYLPAIQQIKLSYVGNEPFDWPDKAPKAISLQSLTIRTSRINEDNLALWLGGAPNLNSLIYRFGIDPDGGEHRWLRCEKLKSSLEARKDKLRLIALHFEIEFSDPDTRYRFGELWGFLNRLGSFRNFDRLTSLMIPITMLLGRIPSEASLKGVLPPSLTRFYPINDCERPETADWDITDLISVLREFAYSYKEETPLLEALSLCSNEDGKWLEEERAVFTSLFRVFENVKLAFELVPRGDWLGIFE